MSALLDVRRCASCFFHLQDSVHGALERPIEREGQLSERVRPGSNASLASGPARELGIDMDWDRLSDTSNTLLEGVGRGMMRLLGSRNGRIIRGLVPIIQRIGDLEKWAEGLDREGMQAKMRDLREAVKQGRQSLDDCLPEVFALVREASYRTLGLRHYDVQLAGGYVLHSQPEGAKGCIAEMMTGEGKTLVATLPLALNAVSGRKVFLVTVNDYLARRDADWMRPVYEFLGLTVGAIQSEMEPWDRKPVYACDIVYGTNNEFGFDYLRDNMKTRSEDQVQSDLYYAIVDEADSALIDEARTPLIISGPAEEHIGKYRQAEEIAQKLERVVHYEVKEKEKTASLLERGIVRAQELLGVESFYVPGFEDWPHYLENALRAKEIYQRDKDYVVEEGEVIIVDEFTGRKMNGRRWSDGLHQAVEVKEGLEPEQETQTLATITFQNYFRMYERLAGMTGTALTEAAEFHKIYGLDVVTVPTNLPIQRADGNDIVYRTLPEKWKAIVEEIERVHATGQPVLVGTTSVEKSEHLSKLLEQRGIPHAVLNARVGQWEREAKIIAGAGEVGAVTVATNMAGRGTDIKLGGNFEARLGLALEAAGLREGDVDHLIEIDAIRSRVREECERDETAVLALGGLCVIGTERHEARRIDNQLRGRTGRQGDVGESRFFLSLQDDLMRIFYREWVTSAMKRLGMEEGVPIESKMVTRAIERAQRKVEEHSFETRKSLLEYDEVMNHQRKVIYGVRQTVVKGKNLKSRVLEMITNVVQRMAGVFVEDPSGFREWCQKAFGFEITDEQAIADAVARKGKCLRVNELVLARYEEREKEFGEELMRRIERYLVLNAIDSKWKDHLHAIDALKAGIGLRGYAQEDPKTAYKKEGTLLFEEKLLPAIEDEVSGLILRIQVERREPPATGAPGQLPGTGRVGALTPHGMTRGPAGPPPTQEQLEAYRRDARRNEAQRLMRPSVSAGRAFDVMRRRQVLAEPDGASEHAPKETARPVEPSTERGNQIQAEPGPPQTSVPAAGRNELCPCGSGRKFKKCHGKG